MSSKYYWWVLPLFLWITFHRVAALDECKRGEEFTCKNGRCIQADYVCDQQFDCSDNSDEQDCGARTCTADYFRCNNGQCVKNIYKCDGDHDCSDHSDEDSQLCANKTCGVDMFACTEDHLECINRMWLCDGAEDCSNGKDEVDCQNVCPEKTFQCKTSKECIDRRFQCDWKSDCEDGSDEADCEKRQCTSSEFQCSSSGKCIDIDLKCDGAKDCDDGSDELNCSTADKCPDTNFACHSGSPRCIPAAWKCDESTECEDFSDEKYCPSSVSSCAEGQVMCNNYRQCINATSKCDGKFDCHDDSDEEDCDRPDINKCLPVESFYTCYNSNLCIMLDRVCDHTIDCPHGDDEDAKRCGSKVCFNNTITTNCSQLCIDTPGSYKCDCNGGYSLDVDKVSCNDIDECETRQHKCHQGCVNTKGSYKCVCYDGFAFDKKLDQCKLIAIRNVSLLYTQQSYIGSVTLHRPVVKKSIVMGLGNVGPIEMETVENYLYWGDKKEDAIYRISMEPSKQKKELLISTNVADIAIDMIHRKIFWTSLNMQNSISVANLDGTYRKTIIDKKDWAPLSIAVAPKYGYIFVSNLATDSAIERFSMSGENGKVLTKINAWVDLTYDNNDELLYWCDGLYGNIYSTTIDGSDVRVVYSSSHLPISLAIFGDKLYWLDRKSHSILSIEKNPRRYPRREKTILSDMHGLAHGITIYNTLKPTDSVNYCAAASCEYLCLPNVTGSGSNFTCMCPDSYIQFTNGSCKKVVATTMQPPISITQPTTTIEAGGPMNPTTSTTAHPTSTHTQSHVHYTSTSRTTSSGTIALAVICSFGIFFLLLFAVRLYCKHRRKLPMSVNFDNPVYRKTTTSYNQFSGSQSSMNEDTPESSKDTYLDTRPNAGLVSNEQSMSVQSTQNGYRYEPVADGDDDSVLQFTDEQNLVKT